MAADTAGKAAPGMLKRALRAVLSWRRHKPPEGRLTSYADRYAVAAVLSLLPLSLPFLLRLFGSDKQKPGEHAYGPAYGAILAPLRWRRCAILEIGVLSGDSLLAWRAALPFGRIEAADIEPKDHLAVGRLRIHRVDQSSGDDLDRLAAQAGPFDVIIDDGSHLSPHQIFTFHRLFPHLREGGTYVIEDVQTSYWPTIVGGADPGDPAFARSCVGEFLELAKYTNHAEFVTEFGIDPARVALARQITRIAFEHNLVIISKGDNTLPSNFRHRIGNVIQDRA